MASKPLSHVNAAGEAAMVDVSAKPSLRRRARAAGQITMSAEAFAKVRDAQLPKGDVLGTARIAGVMAAKRTSDLIPLCHPLALTDVQLQFTLDESLPGVRCEAEVRTVGPTGVEMEALTAVSVALLTVYDMAKAVDSAMRIGEVRLLEKVKE
ncbi:MAG: cyclic pyranopterin monophosphate synthase MoaC [Gemmatimonadaceae bacterium]|nr:cyclic pyranopterin monophosphate synthase MoaC [Gemmatimonadaceae bacterium]MCW5825657.1 cyclic pyranopterin monophosphate synthase MoaC [Gemmatimonadaceae bacterium]